MNRCQHWLSGECTLAMRLIYSLRPIRNVRLARNTDFGRKGNQGSPIMLEFEITLAILIAAFLVGIKFAVDLIIQRRRKISIWHR